MAPNTITLTLIKNHVLDIKELYKLSHLNHIKIVPGWNTIFFHFRDEETKDQRGLATCSWSHRIHFLKYFTISSSGTTAQFIAWYHFPWRKSFHHSQLQAPNVASLNAELGRDEHSWLSCAAVRMLWSERPTPDPQLTSSQHVHVIRLLKLSTALECKPNDTHTPYKTSNSDYKTQTQILLVFQCVSLNRGLSYVFNYAFMFFLFVEGTIVSLQKDLELIYFCYLILYHS